MEGACGLMPVELTSQLAALNENTVHRFANLWVITRKDGIVLRFTDHDRDITFEGNTFGAAIGFNVSATQRQAGLQEQNKEAQGIVVPEGVVDAGSGITFEDLRGGKYRQASVTEYLVDWQYPWSGAFFETQYTVLDMSFDGFLWKAELAGHSKYLRMPVGKFYNRNCRHKLGTVSTPGEQGCEFVLSGNVPLGTLGGSVAAVVTTSVSAVGLQRKTFTLAGISGYIDDAFQDGVCKFTSGDNNGYEFEVSSSISSEVTVYIDTPYDIEIDDTVEITVGCNKTFTACEEIFSNHANFGGFPTIPGADRAVLIPDTK